jgi:hypothetical protein
MTVGELNEQGLTFQMAISLLDLSTNLPFEN